MPFSDEGPRCQHVQQAALRATLPVFDGLVIADNDEFILPLSNAHQCES